MDTGSKFTSKQWRNGLLPEITSARNVLASADRILRQEGTLDRDIDAVFATYSIGVERLLKLALGASAVSQGQGWPTKMGNTGAGWGHALDEMDARLRTGIRESIENYEWAHKDLLRSWICTLDRDPIWMAAIKALRNYADTGRYHHLDQVAGENIKSRSSYDMWVDVERAALESDSALAAHYSRTVADADFDAFEIVLRATVADSIKRWLVLVCLFGQHGVLGEDWRVIGADVLPEDALKHTRRIDGC